MIWQLHVVVFAFAILMLHQAVKSVSPISAVISALTWGYLALLSGSVQVVTDSGTAVNFGYESLAIYCVLLAIASIVVALWAFAEETEDTIPNEAGAAGLGR